MRNTHSTPFRTSRASRHGRPRPSARRVSPAAGSKLILVEAGAIVVADDGVALDVSDQAAIDLVDDPSTATAATIITSLGQNNLSGIRVERFVNWVLTAAGAVAFTTMEP